MGRLSGGYGKAICMVWGDGCRKVVFRMLGGCLEDVGRLSEGHGEAF